MTSAKHPIQQRRAAKARLGKKRRWLRWVVATGLILLFAGGWFYRTMTKPAKLRAIAEQYLQAFFASDLSIDSVHFSPLGGIELTGVTLSDPCAGPGAEPLLTCRQMTLRHKPLALLVGQLRIDSIHVGGARCRFVFDDATGHFNVQDILAQNNLSDIAMKELPHISTGNFEVDVVRRGSNTETLVERLTLNVLALPDPAGVLAYDVVWDALSDRASSGTVRIDFDQMTMTDVKGGTPWLSVRAAALATEAATPGARYWLDLLGLQGMFHAVDFSLPLLPKVEARHRVTIEIEQAALSVPIDDLEMDVPLHERYLTLTDVAGTLTVEQDGATLDLEGLWQDSACNARLRLGGTITEDTVPSDIAFDLELEAKGFTIPRSDPSLAPAESRLIASLPKLAKFYRHYDPHGKIDLSISISKGDGSDAPIVFDRALIEAKGADVSHHKFPYRINNLRGTVEIGPDGVNIMGLTGTHGEGWMVANGWTGGRSGPVPADITIYGYDIPLDGDLCMGLGPRHRAMWDSFDPQGAADIEVNMQRAPPNDGEPAPWHIVTRAELDSAEATYSQFPYPIHDLSGNVIIDGKRIIVSSVQGCSGRGEVAVNGEARTTEHGVAYLDIKIDASQIALDDLLLSCVGDQTREQIQRFRPQGDVDLNVVLSKRSLEGDLDHNIDVHLNGVTIRHTDLVLPITQTVGQLKIDRDRVTVKNVSGVVAGGSVRVDGYVNRESPTSELDIRAECHNVTLDNTVVASFPEHLRSWLREWDVRGTISADAHWKREAATLRQPPDSSIEVNLADVRFRHPNFPVEMRVESGRAIIRGTEFQLLQVRASGDGISVNIDGTIRSQHKTLTADLRIDATLADFTESVQEAAPWRIRKLLGNLQPQGTVHLRGGVLRLKQTPDQASTDWNLTGEIATDRFSVRSGFAFEDLQVSLPFRASSSGGSLSFDGQIDASQITIMGLKLSQLAGNVVYDPRNRQWSLTDLQAKLSESTLTGEIQTSVESSQTRYTASLAYQDVPLDALLPAFSATDGGVQDMRMAGMASGQIFLDGIMGDNRNRRAGGNIRIRDAELYKLPPLLAIFNVINMTLPKESAFQSVDSEFFMLGDDLQIRNLLLQGNALAMVGEGEMKWSSKNIDLKLTAVSPKRTAKIPVVTELLEGASREFVEVRVTGTMAKPVASAQPLRSVSDALETLLRARKDSPRSVSKEKR